MSFKGILDTIGNDAKKVFAFLGSSAGQKDIAVVEGATDTAVDAVDPVLAIPLQSVQTLINNWMAEIFKVQALAAAAGTPSGSGATQAAAVLSAVTPQVTSFLQSQGLSTAAVTTETNTINTALVIVFNTLGSAGPASAIPGTPATTA
jgi:hypothetical protein